MGNTGRPGHPYTSSHLSLSRVLLFTEFSAQNSLKQGRGVWPWLSSTRSLQFTQHPVVMSSCGRPYSSMPWRWSSTLSPTFLLILCLAALTSVTDATESGFVEIQSIFTRRWFHRNRTDRCTPLPTLFTFQRNLLCMMFWSVM